MQFANVARLERLAEHTVLGTQVYRHDDDNLSAIIDTGLSSWAFVFFGFKVLGTRLIWGLACAVLCGLWLRISTARSCLGSYVDALLNLGALCAERQLRTVRLIASSCARIHIHQLNRLKLHFGID